MADQRVIRARRAAHTFLGTLREDDPVVLTESGRSYQMTVMRELHRPDGQFGSWDHSQVVVWFGPGRYSRAVSADELGRNPNLLVKDEAAEDGGHE